MLVVLLVPVRENQPNRFDSRRSAAAPRLTGCLRWRCFCFFFEASGARKASAATCIGCRCNTGFQNTTDKRHRQESGGVVMRKCNHTCVQNPESCVWEGGGVEDLLQRSSQADRTLPGFTLCAGSNSYRCRSRNTLREKYVCGLRRYNILCWAYYFVWYETRNLHLFLRRHSSGIPAANCRADDTVREYF